MPQLTAEAHDVLSRIWEHLVARPGGPQAFRFILQPAMGLGIAARRAPNPAMARLHSLVAHVVFGLGLYLTALAGVFITTRL